MTPRVPLLLIALFFVLGVKAQDKIYKKNGNMIEAKVTEVTNATVIYKRYDNPDGPAYTILKSEVSRIVYQNGIVDKFEATDQDSRSYNPAGNRKHEKSKYGDNILSVIPLAYTAEILNGTINDPGIGICYERLLDEGGHIGITLPFLLSFTQTKDFTSGYFNYNTSYAGTLNNYKSFSLMPGIKFYPARNTERVRYGFGVSFFATFGSEPYAVYDYSGGNYPFGDWHYSMYGLLICNSVNFSVSKHFYVEFDLNGGIPVSDNRLSGQDQLSNLAMPLDQFLLKAGYRF